MAKYAGLNASYQAATPWLPDARAMGASFVRLEMANGVDGVNGLPIPAMAANIRGADLKVLPLVNDYTSAWTSPFWEQEAVKAIPYADMGVIEIANEPYHGGRSFSGQDDATGYAQMVARCADAVNAASRGRVKVLWALGGIGSVGLDYFSATLADWSFHSQGGGWLYDGLAAAPGLLQKIGGVTVHPYQLRPGEPGQIHGDAVQTALGLGVPLYITEAGRKIATDADNVVSDATMQAEEATILLRDWLYNPARNVALAAWYNQHDDQAFDPAADNGWGLSDELGVRRPAWTAYRDAVRAGPVTRERGLPLTPDGAVKMSRARVAPRITIGFLQEADGTLCTTSGVVAPVYTEGYARAPDFSLAVTSDATGAGWSAGYLRSPKGELVVTADAAGAKTVSGYRRSPTGALIATDAP